MESQTDWIEFRNGTQSMHVPNNSNMLVSDVVADVFFNTWLKIFSVVVSDVV